MLSGEEIDARIAHVPPLLDWACLHGADLKRGNYMAVVEGRNWKGYSSCADLAHWLLYRLGCRQPWINRAEHQSGDLGKPGWDVSVNVARLSGSPYAPNSVRRTALPGITVGPGDILISWNLANTSDAHVFVAREEAKLPGELVVAEYGQPGGHIKTKTVVGDGINLHVGKFNAKRIQRWLPLQFVIEDADAKGQLADVSLPWDQAPEAA